MDVDLNLGFWCACKMLTCAGKRKNCKFSSVCMHEMHDT